MDNAACFTILVHFYSRFRLRFLFESHASVATLVGSLGVVVFRGNQRVLKKTCQKSSLLSKRTVLHKASSIH